MIRTNKISFSIDWHAFFSKYSVFRASWSDKNYPSYASLALDAGLKDKDVCSAYSFGKSICFMTTKKSEVKIERVLEEMGEKDFSVSKCSAPEMKSVAGRTILANLMLANLWNACEMEKPWEEGETYGFFNMTGKTYCFVREEGRSKVCLEFSIRSKDRGSESAFFLEMDVVTFTSGEADKEGKLSLKKNKKKVDFEEYIKTNPSYTYREGVLYRRFPPDDTAPSDVYVKRAENKDRHTVLFFDYGNAEGHETKARKLCRIVQWFNKKYAGISEIGLCIVENHVQFVEKTRNGKTTARPYERAGRMVEGIAGEIRSVRIVNDSSRSDASERLETALQFAGVEIKDDSEFCIHIIDSKEACRKAGTDDLYEKEYHGLVTQNIVAENMPKDKDLLLKERKSTGEYTKIGGYTFAILKELMIKKEISSRKLSIAFDSESCRGWSFCLRKRKKKREKTAGEMFSYGVLHVDEEGNLSFERFIEEFKGSAFFKGMEGEIRNETKEDDTGRIPESVMFCFHEKYGLVTIYDSGTFAIPMAEEVEALVKNHGGDVMKSNKNFRERVEDKSLSIDVLLEAVEAIRYWKTDDPSVAQYMVAPPKSTRSRNTAVATSAHIRNVVWKKDKGVEEWDELMHDLLKMMDVVFVRNMALTVVPFPFKYIREFLGFFETEGDEEDEVEA